MRRHDIAVIAGDGIGPEVTAEARRAVDAAAGRFGFAAGWTAFPFGAEHYLATGETLPPSALAELAGFDALLLGAVGDPRVKPGPLEQGILLTLRFHFDQYVNLRPALSFPGAPLPAAPSTGSIDAVVVRENTEDLYMGLGGGGKGSFATDLAAQRGLYRLSGNIDLRLDPETEAAFSLGLVSRPGAERIARYAFDLAKKRGENRVTAVSKANAVPHLYGFWDRVTREVAEREYPGLEYRPMNVDALCYLACRDPGGWGVMLCPNLFGDIVSDLFSGLAGGLGLAAAGNIGPGLSMFEPVHGSAPGIAGRDKANPIAAILSAAMLLDHVGEKEAAAAVNAAVRRVLAEGGRALPRELGGEAGTREIGERIAGAIRESGDTTST